MNQDYIIGKLDSIEGKLDSVDKNLAITATMVSGIKVNFKDHKTTVDALAIKTHATEKRVDFIFSLVKFLGLALGFLGTLLAVTESIRAFK